MTALYYTSPLPPHTGLLDIYTLDGLLGFCTVGTPLGACDSLNCVALRNSVLTCLYWSKTGHICPAFPFNLFSSVGITCTLFPPVCHYMTFLRSQFHSYLELYTMIGTGSPSVGSFLLPTYHPQFRTCVYLLLWTLLWFLPPQLTITSTVVLPYTPPPTLASFYPSACCTHLPTVPYTIQNQPSAHLPWFKDRHSLHLLIAFRPFTTSPHLVYSSYLPPLTFYLQPVFTTCMSHMQFPDLDFLDRRTDVSGCVL